MHDFTNIVQNIKQFFKILFLSFFAIANRRWWCIFRCLWNLSKIEAKWFNKHWCVGTIICVFFFLNGALLVLILFWVNLLNDWIVSVLGHRDLFSACLVLPIVIVFLSSFLICDIRHLLQRKWIRSHCYRSHWRRQIILFLSL